MALAGAEKCYPSSSLASTQPRICVSQWECSVPVTARSDLHFLVAGGVQKSPAQGGDVPNRLSARAVPSHALRDGCLHAWDRHAG